MRSSIALFVSAFVVLTGAEAAPAADKAGLAAIQSATAGRMKATKGKVHDKACGEDVEYEAEAVDLNGDGRLEVLTQEFGSCFGRAGVQMNLYIESAKGRWKSQFGFPGTPRVLKTRNRGFPDIEVQGPGTCFPVWRYDGQQYRIHKRCR